MTKIPVTRLKIAQIDGSTLPVDVLELCKDKDMRAFAPIDPDDTEFFVHGDIFEKIANDISDEYGSLYHRLEELNKQFVSFDYIMII